MNSDGMAINMVGDPNQVPSYDEAASSPKPDDRLLSGPYNPPSAPPSAPAPSGELPPPPSYEEVILLVFFTITKNLQKNLT